MSRMDYQIVPNTKHVCEKVKKRYKATDNCSKKAMPHICDASTEGSVYILQPMFKPPKSTKDLANGKSAEDEMTVAVKAVSDGNNKEVVNYNNNNNGQFNHFTMSRKGIVKYNELSRVEVPLPLTSSPSPITDSGINSEYNDDNNKIRKYNNNTSVQYEGIYAHPRRVSCVDQQQQQSVKRQLSRDHRSRRASAGDELIKYNLNHSNSGYSGPNEDRDGPRVVSIGPDEVMLIPHQKRQSSSHDPSCQHNNNGHVMSRRNSAGKSSTQENNRLQVPSEYSLPRRKSFHDWCSMQQWYLPDPRPMSSSDRDASTRRNVISPNTLSRMLPPGVEQGPRHASGSISVCTEGDRMSYNFNLPSRRLVSHKDLKNCSLPYNDNIGLEETVTSDQARKASKSKPSVPSKAKLEANHQTPKQVWYRTVRSILAANYLYHTVKRKE